MRLIKILIFLITLAGIVLFAGATKVQADYCASERSQTLRMPTARDCETGGTCRSENRTVTVTCDQTTCESIASNYDGGASCTYDNADERWECIGGNYSAATALGCWVLEATPSPSPCVPVCNSPYCGQADGCGGTCASTDAGAPAAPALSPANGGTVTVIEGQQATVSWSAPAKADSYELELYPAGTNCLASGAYCDSSTGLTYTFLPLYPSYFYRVRALNSTCSTEWGAWAAATFSVRGTITGTVKQDDNRLAVLIGGVCQLAGAPGVQPGAGSRVTVGVDSGNVNVNGTYSLTSPIGSSKVAVLSLGDPAQWRCTCPSTCIYSTSAPKSGLDYFVSNIKDPWWQAEEGNVHANGGDVRSRIPSTATWPYLITGTQPGLVSYTGGLDINDAEAINQNLSNWQAQTKYKGRKTDYGYFKRILEDDPLDFGAWYGGQPGTSGVYAAEGEMVTLEAMNITNEIIVILVNGDVFIDYDISVAEGGFLAIISSGNITIGDAVTNVQGVYVANGIISSGTSNSQLTGEGIFTGWQGIDLGRDFNTMENNTTPIERFIYRPDLVRNAYRYLLNPKISWQEVAP